MELPPLKNQKIPSKKLFSLRFLFNLFFAISLGFNIYFLVFEEGSNLVDNVHATGLAEVETFKKQTAIHIGKSINTQARTTLGFKGDPVGSPDTTAELSDNVKQVLFDKSVHANKSSIQTLKLKVRKSLNFTVCQEVKVNGECGVLSAHLARLLAWFLDVNRNLRNGDILNVVYQRLNSEGKLKIRRLTFKSNYL